MRGGGDSGDPRMEAMRERDRWEEYWTTTVYECIYCDFSTEDEQEYNRHMFDHQEAEEGPDPERLAQWRDQPRILFMWDGKIVQ